MKETYQIVSLKDGTQDFAAIIQTLREIHSGKLKNDLRLINYYHEVPVSYPVVIEHVDAEMVDLKVHQSQSVVLAAQKQALLKSAAFPQGLGVHALTERVNVPKCAVTLGRFAYASIRADRRESVRVTVDGQVEATYQTDQQTVIGWLQDISLTGCALLSDSALPTGIADQGTARLTLDATCLSVPARLVNSRQKDGGYLHTFQIEVDKQADKVISQYIYNRQVQIIQALKEQFG